MILFIHDSFKFQLIVWIWIYRIQGFSEYIVLAPFSFPPVSVFRSPFSDFLSNKDLYLAIGPYLALQAKGVPWSLFVVGAPVFPAFPVLSLFAIYDGGTANRSYLSGTKPIQDHNE